MAESLQLVLSILFFPITLLGSWIVIAPNEEAVLLSWGRFARVITQPGLYWCNLWGRRIIRISTRQQALELPKSVVADGNGNPIVIAAVVTYRFTDSRKTALDVEHASEFLRSQALAVLKRVAATYPYESTSGHSLKSEADIIGQHLVEALQEKVTQAGALVLGFQLSDLTYAPEIAPAMLIRQQAKALIEARKTIVEGAVEIVREAIEMLQQRGIQLPDAERTRLATNLLTVICGDAKVQPTYPISGGVPESTGGDHAPQQRRIEDALTRIAKKLEGTA